MAFLASDQKAANGAKIANSLSCLIISATSMFSRGEGREVWSMAFTSMVYCKPLFSEAGEKGLEFRNYGTGGAYIITLVLKITIRRTD